MDSNYWDGYVSAAVNFVRTSQFLFALEFFLAALVVWILLKKNDKKKTPLSFEEEERMIAEYSPEPLVKDVDSNHPRLNLKIVHGKARRHINIDGVNCLNFATNNYLGLHGDDYIEQTAMDSVRKYGVGSCGPRGFYGTVDVHLELEERLAKYFNQEEAVVYSYGFSTIASAIPAYSKRRDIVFADENVNFAIQKGLDASRSEVIYFKHNDMKHLKSLLEEQAARDAKNKSKAQRTRRFLIVEGVYMNTGCLCPLPQLIALKNQYKLRIFIDESISFGTIGKTGRGVTEHFGVPVDEVDLIMSSLEWAVGSIGGFCVGSSFIIEHQRLSGLGYCFSASLPPLLTRAAISSLDKIEQSPQLITNLQELSFYCHESIQGSKLTSQFELKGDPITPIKHLIPIGPLDTFEFVSRCINKNIAVAASNYLDGDKQKNPPSIVITINTLLIKADIDSLINTLIREIAFELLH